MKVIVIVDAYSSGEKLVYAFKSYGYQIIHIQSTPEIPKVFKEKFQQIKNLFIENIVFNGVEPVKERLSCFQVKCIIPGTESGVIIADNLCHQMGMELANDLIMSHARRDKGAMHNALNQAGLSSIPYCRSHKLEEIKAWAKNEISKFEENNIPIVLKPLQSAGTDNVYFCYTEKEVEQAYDCILKSSDLFDKKNVEVLAQTFQKGEEYIVNTVSHQGSHFITDVWHIKKKEINRIPIYDFEELILPDDSVYSVVVNYARKALDALHIKFGASHSEIMLTQDGPVLIETGARLMGSCDFSAVAEVSGFNQVSKLIESYLATDKFLKTIPENNFKNKKYILNVFLISNASGRIIKSFDTNNFKKIEGLHSFSFDCSLGYDLEQTRNLLTSPGHIYLISEDRQLLFEGYKKIRELEKTLYSNLITD